jgi:hypothetical protein
MWCDDVMAIEAVGHDLEADASGTESAGAGPCSYTAAWGKSRPTGLR